MFGSGGPVGGHLAFIDGMELAFGTAAAVMAGAAILALFKKPTPAEDLSPGEREAATPAVHV